MNLKSETKQKVDADPATLDDDGRKVEVTVYICSVVVLACAWATCLVSPCAWATCQLNRGYF